MEEKYNKYSLPSLVFGIYTFVLSFIPIIGIVSFPISIVGIIYGCIGVQESRLHGGKPKLVIGVILCILSIVLVFINIFLIELLIEYINMPDVPLQYIIA